VADNHFIIEQLNCMPRWGNLQSNLTKY